MPLLSTDSRRRRAARPPSRLQCPSDIGTVPLFIEGVGLAEVVVGTHLLDKLPAVVSIKLSRIVSDREILSLLLPLY